MPQSLQARAVTATTQHQLPTITPGTCKSNTAGTQATARRTAVHSVGRRSFEPPVAHPNTNLGAGGTSEPQGSGSRKLASQSRRRTRDAWGKRLGPRTLGMEHLEPQYEQPKRRSTDREPDEGDSDMKTQRHPRKGGDHGPYLREGRHVRHDSRSRDRSTRKDRRGRQMAARRHMRSRSSSTGSPRGTGSKNRSDSKGGQERAAR